MEQKGMGKKKEKLMCEFGPQMLHRKDKKAQLLPLSLEFWRLSWVFPSEKMNGFWQEGFGGERPATGVEQDYFSCFIIRSVFVLFELKIHSNRLSEFSID